MSERMPFSILTFDAFQGEYIDERISKSYATKDEAELEANYLLAELQSVPDLSENEEDSTYTLYLVGPDGDRTFYKRG